MSGQAFRASTTMPSRRDTLGPLAALGWASAASVLFHGGYRLPGGWLMLAFPTVLFALVWLPSARSAFYVGLTLGLGLYAPHLGFFWTLFGPAAVILWLVLAFWVAAFLGVGQSLRQRLPPTTLIVALLRLWTGLEYFRSELYLLRFSWLSPALALVEPPNTPALAPAFHRLGGYGVGFILALAASLIWFAPGRLRLSGPLLLGSLVAVSAAFHSRSLPSPESVRSIAFAGAQIESTAESDIIPVLNRLRSAHPNAQLILLPEYSLGGEPDAYLLDWCRQHGCHLIVGGRTALEGNQFYNTAFVVDTNGVVVFRQAKSVPIQFFDDGLPAPSQALWHSPWGRIGIAICYDLSYTRVIDRLVRAGAEALVIPTMDATSWGAYQHALHARIAPLRAAEYGLSIARVASSGISQSVDASGRVTASAPFSDNVEFLHGILEICGPGSVPPTVGWLLLLLPLPPCS